jgi:hypothetical protein
MGSNMDITIKRMIKPMSRIMTGSSMDVMAII